MSKPCGIASPPEEYWQDLGVATMDILLPPTIWHCRLPLGHQEQFHQCGEVIWNLACTKIERASDVRP